MACFADDELERIQRRSFSRSIDDDIFFKRVEDALAPPPPPAWFNRASVIKFSEQRRKPSVRNSESVELHTQRDAGQICVSLEAKVAVTQRHSHAYLARVGLLVETTLSEQRATFPKLSTDATSTTEATDTL